MRFGFDDWFGFSGGGLSYWGDLGKKPPLHGVLGRTLVEPEPSGAARYGCHTLPEARSEAWAWGLGGRGSQAWFWPPRPI